MNNSTIPHITFRTHPQLNFVAKGLNPKLLCDILGVVDNFGLVSSSVVMLGDDLRLMSLCGMARVYNDPYESPFCDKPGDELRRSCAALMTALLLDRRRSRLRLIKGLIMLKAIYKPTKFTEQAKFRWKKL